MIKFIFVVGMLLIVLSIAMYIYDFLPVTWFQPMGEDEYLKVVAIESSFSWLQLRLPALILGLTLLVISVYLGSFKQDVL